MEAKICIFHFQIPKVWEIVHTRQSRSVSKSNRLGTLKFGRDFGLRLTIRCGNWVVTNNWQLHDCMFLRNRVPVKGRKDLRAGWLIVTETEETRISQTDAYKTGYISQPRWRSHYLDSILRDSPLSMRLERRLERRSFSSLDEGSFSETNPNGHRTFAIPMDASNMVKFIDGSRSGNVERKYEKTGTITMKWKWVDWI